MRISDWSSDVCSSDLQHARRARRRGGDAGRSADGAAVPDAGQCPDDGAGVAAPRLCHLGSREMAHDPDGRTGRGGGPRQLAAATRLRLFLWLRSEEHTSELQSLMRISYAVFCLKKK